MIAKIGIAAGIAGAGYLAYHCYSPTSQLYGPTLCHHRDPKSLALTYDDGPNDNCTPRLLDLLANSGVQATFFLIGKFVAAKPQLAREIGAAGHLLANHTYSHPNLLLLGRTAIRQQLVDGSAAIADATAVQPIFFRPPFGARRPAVLREASELGLKTVMWDVTCYDWRRTTAEKVERHARNGVDRDSGYGHIILLHDGRHTKMGADQRHTLEATRRVLLRYGDSHQFRRIDEIESLNAGTNIVVNEAGV